MERDNHNNYLIKKIDKNNFEEIIVFQEVIRGLEKCNNYSFIGPNSLNKFSNKGGILGLYDSKNMNEIIGFGVYSTSINEVFVTITNEKLKKENSSEIGYLVFSMIHPDYRGHGLQGLLFEKRENILKDNGFKKSFVCTHKDNLKSKGNIISKGYDYHSTLLKNNEYYRDLYCKEI